MDVEPKIPAWFRIDAGETIQNLMWHAASDMHATTYMPATEY